MQRLPAVVALRHSQTTTTYVREWLTSPLERRHRVNDINHSRPRDSAWILAVVDQGGNHCAVNRADQRRDELGAHRASRPVDDLGDGVDPLAQATALDFPQSGQAG